MTRLGSGIDLVARESELHELTEALRHAGEGHPGMSLLSGDAGIGKSRLVCELTRHAADRDALVLTGRCLDTDAALPYLPFVEILRQLSSRAPRAWEGHPDAARLLPGGSTSRPQQEFGQLPLFDAVHAVLDEVTRETTVLLVVEDLHWADRSSRELLSFLASRLQGQRLLIVGTIRSDDLHRRHPLRALLAELVRLSKVTRLQLDPLGDGDTERFVRELAGPRLPEQMIAAIARRSEGNAFLAEELVSAASADVPPELAEVLLSRVERLSDAGRSLVRLGAVIGRRFSHPELEASTDLDADDLDQALRDAIAHHVLIIDEVTGEYAFRHALLHEAIYQDLLPGQRFRQHARIAEALRHRTGPGVAARLAHHATESHDVAGALRASILAAEEAAEHGAPAEALVHAEHALSVWHAVEDPESVSGRCELELTRLATWAAEVSGDPDRAIALGRSAIELAGDADVRLVAELRCDYADYLMTLDGFGPRALETLEKAWQLLSGTEPSAITVRVQAILARASLMVGRREEAARLATEAMTTAEPLTDDAARAAAANARVTLTVVDRRRLGLREITESFAIAVEQAAEVGDAHTELRARYLAGIAELEAGNLAEASRQWHRGVGRAAETGMTWSNYGLELRVVQVLGRYMTGDWDDAESAARLAGESVSNVVLTRISAAGLLVAVGRGDSALARRRLHLLRDRWMIDSQVLTFAGLCEAELELHESNPTAAAAAIEQTMSRLNDVEPGHMAAVSLCAVGISAYTAIAAEAEVAKDAAAVTAAREAGLRLAALADDTVKQGRTHVGTMGPEGRAWCHRVRAETARLRGAPDPQLWRETVRAFEYGEPYRTAQARLRLAEALLESGQDRDEAVESLRRAGDTARRLDARPLITAIGQLSRRARVTAEEGGSGPLTPRETGVLAEVAAGSTNRQIGQRLFISEKTVSVHLSRAMAKLGATSRTEAVTRAYARGILSPDDQ